MASASTIGRTAADTLFLTRFDSSHLSRMYLPQAAALILAGFLFQRFGGRLRIDQWIRLLVPAIAGLTLASRAGVALGHDWVLPVIYVAYDVFNFLMVVCFWQFATAVMDQRKAKKMIGIVGSGGIAGGIVSGFGLKLAVPLIGTANLIYVYAALPLLALAAVTALTARCPDPAATFAARPQAAKPTSSAKKRPAQGRAGMFRSVPHLTYVAILSASLVISLTFVDYQFKSVLRASLQNEQLAGFMGTFYGMAGILALLVQTFLAGKLLTRFGVMTAILIFPAALFAGSLGVLLMPTLAMVVLAKGSDKVLGDTINSNVNQLILFPIPPEWRNRAKSFLDGVVRNGAKGAAAVSLMVLSPLLSVRGFSAVILALLAVCMLAAVKIRDAYLRMLLSTLQHSESGAEDGELNLMDPASQQLLSRTLASPDKQQVLYAMRVLAEVEGFDWAAHLPGLLRHSAPEVAVGALDLLERLKLPSCEAELPPMLAHPERQVRARALTALAAYAKDEHLETITAYLDDPDIELRSGAIAGLVKSYGIEGMFRAVGLLKQWNESGDERERAAMAALIGRIGIREFHKPLIPLLRDASADVRRNALLSAARLQAPELVGPIVALLRHGDTRSQAIEALSAYDEADILPLLEPLFRLPDPPMHLPKVYERIGTPAAYRQLLQQYAPASPPMKDRLLEALTRLRRNVEQTDRRQTEACIRMELETYRRFSEALAWLRADPANAEIAEAAAQIRAAVIRRIFGLFGLVHEPRTMQAIYAGWSEGDARQQANAVEALDQLLQGEWRLAMAEVLNPGKAGAVQPEGAGGWQEAKLRELESYGDAWLSLAIRYAAMLRTAQLRELEPEPEREWLTDHMARIRALRALSMFQGLAGGDLSALAARLEPVRMQAGDVIFDRGEPGDALYVIREGQAGVYRGGERIDGKMAGEGFGQTAILTRRPRTAAVRAEADGWLWRLDSAAFYEIVFDRTDIALEMMKRLSRMMRMALATDRSGKDRGTDGQANAETHAEAEAGAGRAEAAAAAAISAVEAGAGAGAEDMAASPAGDSADRLLRRLLVLQKIDLFANLSGDDFVRLAGMVDEIAYEPGEAVCHMEEYGDTLYGIIRGSVRVHRGGESLAVLGEGDCFGEMAIIDSGPRSADCTAETETVLLQLHRDQVFSFCFQNIDVLKSMMQVLADRLRGLA